MLPKLLPLLLLPSLIQTSPTRSIPHQQQQQHQQPFWTDLTPNDNPPALPTAQFETTPYFTATHEFEPQRNTCNPPALRIFRATWNGGRDISSLLTYTIVGGATCWLEFDYPWSLPNGQAKEIDVFSQQTQPVDRCPSSTNARNNRIGRLRIPGGGGHATWVATDGDYLNKPGQSRCPSSGTVVGIELVATGDDANLLWTQGSGTGLRIIWK